MQVDAEGLALTAALAGEVGATAAIEVGPVNATLGPVRVRTGSQPVAELRRAALINAGLRLPENRVSIEAVELSGAKNMVALDREKNLNWTGILQKAGGAPAAARGDTQSTVAAPLDVQLARLSLDGIEVGIVDGSPARPVKLDVTQGFVTLKNLSLDMNKAVPFETGFSFRQGGRFNAIGIITPGSTSGQLELRLAGLSLNPFAPV